MITKSRDTSNKSMTLDDYLNRNKIPVVSRMYWWLGRRRPFYIGDEYEISLLEIDRKSGSAKIQITNLKTGKTDTQEV